MNNIEQVNAFVIGLSVKFDNEVLRLSGELTRLNQETEILKKNNNTLVTLLNGMLKKMGGIGDASNNEREENKESNGEDLRPEER